MRIGAVFFAIRAGAFGALPRILVVCWDLSFNDCLSDREGNGCAEAGGTCLDIDNCRDQAMYDWQALLHGSPSIYTVPGESSGAAWEAPIELMNRMQVSNVRCFDMACYPILIVRLRPNQIRKIICSSFAAELILLSSPSLIAQAPMA